MNKGKFSYKNERSKKSLESKGQEDKALHVVNKNREKGKTFKRLI